MMGMDYMGLKTVEFRTVQEEGSGSRAGRTIFPADGA